MFVKHTAKYSVIFKPMDFQQLIERVICGGEILVNMGKANFVNIFQISAAHMLFEKAAEIFGLQRQYLKSPE